MEPTGGRGWLTGNDSAVILGMGIIRNALVATGLIYRAEPEYAPTTQILPPSRSTGYSVVTTDTAVSLSMVYRALQILTTAAGQISISVERAGGQLPEDQVSSLLKKPCLEMSRSDFFEQAVMALAVSGNAYWRKIRAVDKSIANLVPLNPHEVFPTKHKGQDVFSYRGEFIPAADVVHLAFMRLPGKATGLGPIQAAQRELRGAIDLRDYSSGWFTEAGVPNAVLTTEQAITPTDAKAIKEQWYGTPEDPKAGHGMRVLGKGLHYEPMMLKPSDAQWLESRQFTTTEIARLFGVPASLMLAVVEGGSDSYSNVEQDWLAFTRFTLMGYLRKIEEALTDLAPRGQTVRFNVESLLRTDTKTRYEGHTLAVGRWMTVPEIRRIENLPPLSEAELAQLTTPAPAPATQEQPA